MSRSCTVSTARRHASAAYAVVVCILVRQDEWFYLRWLWKTHNYSKLSHFTHASCVCLSVRPSVTSRFSTETAQCRITQTTPHDWLHGLQDWLHGLHDWTVSSEHLRFMFLVSSLFFFVWFPCGRLSWLHVSFWAHDNIVHHIISYHIISYHIIVNLIFCCRRSQQNWNGVNWNGAGKCRWERLNAGAVTANWRHSTQLVVNFVRSQVYHTERPPYLFAARSPWCSASSGFVSDSWSLSIFCISYLHDEWSQRLQIWYIGWS